MKKHNYPLLLIFLLMTVGLVSCKKNQDVNDQSNVKDETIVLIERASSTPFILSNKTSAKSGSSTQVNGLPDGQLDIKYYLGRSYNTKISEIGSPDGVKFPVIDIDKLYAANPDYFKSIKIGTSDAQRFSFSDFERYQEKSNKSSTVTGGFSLKIGFFSIGTKHKFSNTFSSDVVTDNKKVFGELNVRVKDASYELLLSSNVINKVKDDYLNATFLDELYNTSPSEFVNNYGAFLITNFIAGGRANALFTGTYLSASDTQTKEKSMDNSISASYTFKEKSKDSVGANIGIGNGNGSTIAKSNNIGEFRTSVKTYGGSYGYSAFTVPKSIDDINIDLSTWASSMNDKSKHVLIDFNDNGLRPISDLLLQENIRYNLDRYATTSSESKPLEVPRIEARWRYIMSGGIGFVTVVLKTRFGDELLISDNSTVLQFQDLNAMQAFAKQEALKKLPFYKVAVTANYMKADDVSNYTTSIVNIDEASMKKFYDVKHKMLYLLSQANGKKFAYSIHNDFLLDTYAIRDWVNGMTTTVVTPAELESYTVIGL